MYTNSVSIFCPAHLKYKQYKGPGISHWTLEDVYMETSYVLSGLSRKAGLRLLSISKSSVSYLTEEPCSDNTAHVANNQEYHEAMVEEQFSNTTSHSQEDINIAAESTAGLERPSTNSCLNKEACSTSEMTSQSLNCMSASSEKENHMIHASSLTCKSANESMVYSSNERTSTNDPTAFNNCCEASSSTCEVLPVTEDVLPNFSLNSAVNDCCDLVLSESTTKVATPCKAANLANVEKCTVSPINSTVNDCRGSTVCESDTKVSIPCKVGNLANVKKCTVSSFNSTVNDRCGSTVCESDTEVTLRHGAEKFSNAEKSTFSVNSTLSDCCDSTVGHSSTELASPHKAENLSNVETSTDISFNSTLNHCGDSTVGHCDTPTLSKDKMHESDEDEYICVTDEETDRPCSDSKWDTSDDLPLMANVDEVLVTHYVLNLSVNFSDKVMNGDITLFLKPATDIVTQRQFQLCLDCSLVDIESVEEIDLKDDFSVKQYGDNTSYSSYPSDVFQVDKFKKVPVALPYTLLPYAVRNWCVRIWKPYKLGRTWPRCVRIKYCTRPEGKSLTWTTDQDNRYMRITIS